MHGERCNILDDFISNNNFFVRVYYYPPFCYYNNLFSLSFILNSPWTSLTGTWWLRWKLQTFCKWNNRCSKHPHRWVVPQPQTCILEGFSPLIITAFRGRIGCMKYFLFSCVCWSHFLLCDKAKRALWGLCVNAQRCSTSQRSNPQLQCIVGQHHSDNFPRNAPLLSALTYLTTIR